jgi:transposase-like protein
MADKIKHGTHQTCEKHPNAKLTVDRIFAARQRRKSGETLQDLAAEFGVHRETLFKAVSGETWKPIAVGAFSPAVRETEALLRKKETKG